MEPNKSTPMRTFLRVAVIGGIIALLVILSIGIVKIVPRVVSSLASATVSITSLFNNDATSTNPTQPGGFVVVDKNASSTYNASSSISTSGSKPYTTNTSASYQNNSGYNANSYTNGIPDLAISIVSKGVINPANGNYIETNNITSSDTVIVKFRIENRGAGPSGNFNLTVVMPAVSVADRLRQLTSVGSIPAGAAIEAQVVFTNPQVGSNLPVTITADPSSLTRDNNRSNNSQSVNLNVTQGSGPIVTGGNNTPYGQPDIVVQIAQVGILDQFNRFIPTTNIPYNARVAVQFKIINQGTNANMTSGWFFRAEMTDYPNVNKLYQSDIQAGLVGGQSVTYTLGFDNLRVGSNSITIYTDSQNNIYETNENNNIGTVNFNVY